MESYPRYLTGGFEPYDPIGLTARTEAAVCRGLMRKYTRFTCAGVYGGISTGYTVGCNLRCAFCWVGWSRDFPERSGRYYGPRQVLDKLVRNAGKRGVRRLRISGGEPALGREHLLGVLDLADAAGYEFILETNGILFGADPGYVRALRKYVNVHVRLCIKAGTAAGFEARTGARGEFWELPYRGVTNLMEAGVSFHVACMSDPRLMPAAERESMLRTLEGTGCGCCLEEEICEPYSTSVARMEHAGFDIF